MSTCRVCDAPTDAFLCRAHGAELARALGDAKSLLHEVGIVASGQARVYRSGGKPQPVEDEDWLTEWRAIPAHLRSLQGRITLPATRAMVNIDARELMWDALNTLTTWARTLAESRSCEIPPDWLTWMAHNAESFRFSEEAEQVWDEITYLNRRLVSAVDRSPSRLYAGPCHAKIGHLAEAFDPAVRDGLCQRDLYAKPGQVAIVCDGHRGDEQGCGATHTPEQRRDWLLAAVEDALLPFDTWRTALPGLLPTLPKVPYNTMKAWVDKGRLVPHGRAHGGDLFRGGDVVELVRGYRPHRYPDRKARRTA
jgi:hypothetical protein